MQWNPYFTFLLFEFHVILHTFCKVLAKRPLRQTLLYSVFPQLYAFPELDFPFLDLTKLTIFYFPHTSQFLIRL